MTDRPAEVSFKDRVGLEGLCPQCRQQGLLMTVGTAADARITHSRSLRVCKSRTASGPKYYVHIVRLDADGERVERADA